MSTRVEDRPDARALAQRDPHEQEHEPGDDGDHADRQPGAVADALVEDVPGVEAEVGLHQQREADAAQHQAGDAPGQPPAGVRRAQERTQRLGHPAEDTGGADPAGSPHRDLSEGVRTMTGCCSRSGAPSAEASARRRAPGASPTWSGRRRSRSRSASTTAGRCSTYEGPARDLVARVKYRNLRASVPWLAEGMAAMVPPGAVEVVTWAPTSARSPPPSGLRPRRGARGRGGSPARRAERRAPRSRARDQPRPDGAGPIAGGAPTSRRHRPPGAGPGRPSPSSTTCSPPARRSTAAARALRSGGAGAVVGLVAARTPNHPAG